MKRIVVLAVALLSSGCFWFVDDGPYKSELDTAKDQAAEDLHCDDVDATVFHPGYVGVYGCSTRATYECSQARHGAWSCRRMY